jgi:hypothetical protein
VGERCFRFLHSSKEFQEQRISILLQTALGLLFLESFLLRREPPSEPSKSQRDEKNKTRGSGDDEVNVAKPGMMVRHGFGQDTLAADVLHLYQRSPMNFVATTVRSSA